MPDFQISIRVPTMSTKEIYYSDKYNDDKFEYRHVMLPKVCSYMMA
jgi:cyclin-dependent kinase regulatory subunit CKS1